MSLSAVHNKTIQQPLSICSLFFSLVVDSAFPSLLSVMITWWIQWKHQSSSNLDGYILMSVPKQGFCTLFPYTLQDEGAKWNWKCDKSTFQNFNHDLLLNKLRKDFVPKTSGGSVTKQNNFTYCYEQEYMPCCRSFTEKWKLESSRRWDLLQD